MRKYKVTCWYPMEGEVIIEATDEEDAKNTVMYKPGTKIDFEDSGEFFIKEVVQVDDNGDEVEDDGHGLDDSIIGSLP